MSAVTDSEGKYRMKVSADQYDVSVEIDEDHEDPGSQSANLNPGDAVTVDFSLRRKATISGQVLDDAGNPIAGKTVTATKI